MRHAELKPGWLKEQIRQAFDDIEYSRNMPEAFKAEMRLAAQRFNATHPDAQGGGGE